MQRAVFLDRDGTVIVDKSYLDTVDGVELLPGAVEGLRAMADLGYLLVLVTNQSGIGRGYFQATVVEAQHERLQQLLAPHGITFAAMVYCPHAPEAGCACRKPAPGMLLQAAEQIGADCANSWMIGDKEADATAGIAAGCRTIIIGKDTKAIAETVAVDLREAARYIAEHP